MSGGFIVIPRKDWWICCKCGNPLLLSLGIQKTFLHLLLSEGRSVSIDGQMGQAKWEARGTTRFGPVLVFLNLDSRLRVPSNDARNIQMVILTITRVRKRTKVPL
jgi:hypothetical protein